VRIDPALQRWLRGFLIVFGAWTLVGLFYLSQDAGRRSFFGDPRPWQETMYWAVRVYVSAAFTPLILWLGRRWPIERPHLALRFAWHILAAAAYAVGEVAVETAVLLHATHPPGFVVSSYRRSVAILLIFGFHANVISYGLILGIQSGFRYYRKYREREQQAMRLELDASELRAQIAGAQLSALKMQLQPHFLFNTLNAIMVLVRQQRGQKAEETLGRFSDLLRAVLSDIDAQEVSLNRELEYVRLYLSIEEVRFPDRLRMEIDAAPEVLPAMVPHMGLQPLVENAVRHGIAKNAGAGLIVIRAVRADEQLQISVSDNGPGMRAGGIAGSTGIGLANTRNRLNQLYGEHAALVMRPREGGGTVAMISIPFRLGESA
jgi:two-component system LytT family sensor kinase